MPSTSRTRSPPTFSARPPTCSTVKFSGGRTASSFSTTPSPAAAPPSSRTLDQPVPHQAVIGLIGGMSWESSSEYYRIINQTARDRLGGVHSARSLMWSVDFGEIERLQHDGEWDRLAEAMKDAARRLERGGADFLVLCTNTMHRMADDISGAVAIPLLHIADPTAERIKEAGYRRVGLLGTAFTMEQDFYKGRLREQHRLDVIVPEAEDRRIVHEVIYKELVAGRVNPASKAAYRAIIARLIEQGAQAIILGCTEIMLLVSAEDSAVPLFDTTTIHAVAAVERSLGDG
ncbi:aspartate/glutamate racemase family protein [Microvirga sp. BT291]|nr:aspartate/glutamate racemase family protein [Microvirga pudoricolor]